MTSWTIGVLAVVLIINQAIVILGLRIAFSVFFFSFSLDKYSGRNDSARAVIFLTGILK